MENNNSYQVLPDNLSQLKPTTALPYHHRKVSLANNGNLREGSQNGR